MSGSKAKTCADMGTVLMFGLMAPDLMASGGLTKHMEKVSFTMRTVMSTMVIGLRIKRKGSEFTSTQMAHVMKVNGLRICSMVRELKLG